MIARPKPSPDDGPDPERVTPGRLARRLHRIGERLSRLQFELRSLSPYLDRGPLEGPHDQVRSAACAVVDLATAVRVGQVALVPDYLEPGWDPNRPILDAIETAPLRARPLLDRIESAPTHRAAAAIAPAVAARPADDPNWDEVRRCRVCGCTDDDCRHCVELTGEPCHWVEADLCSACVTPGVRPRPEHPAAGPARAAAKRRKSLVPGPLSLGCAGETEDPSIATLAAADHQPRRHQAAKERSIPVHKAKDQGPRTKDQAGRKGGVS